MLHCQFLCFLKNTLGIGRCLTDSRSVRELDITNVVFEHPKCFYDVCSAILNERCRLCVLKLRGIHITQLEGKIIQYILMKNKMLTTFDISHCYSDDPENLAVSIIWS